MTALWLWNINLWIGGALFKYMYKHFLNIHITVHYYAARCCRRSKSTDRLVVFKAGRYSPFCRYLKREKRSKVKCDLLINSVWELWLIPLIILLLMSVVSAKEHHYQLAKISGLINSFCNTKAALKLSRILNLSVSSPSNLRSAPQPTSRRLLMWIIPNYRVLETNIFKECLYSARWMVLLWQDELCREIHSHARRHELQKLASTSERWADVEIVGRIQISLISVASRSLLLFKIVTFR